MLTPKNLLKFALVDCDEYFDGDDAEEMIKMIINPCDPENIAALFDENFCCTIAEQRTRKWKVSVKTRIALAVAMLQELDEEQIHAAVKQSSASWNWCEDDEEEMRGEGIESPRERLISLLQEDAEISDENRVTPKGD